jgi:hypothetical protein
VPTETFELFESYSSPPDAMCRRCHAFSRNLGVVSSNQLLTQSKLSINSVLNNIEKHIKRLTNIMPRKHKSFFLETGAAASCRWSRQGHVQMRLLCDGSHGAIISRAVLSTNGIGLYRRNAQTSRVVLALWLVTRTDINGVKQ